jgi:predicted PurR-regulated permease PerM
MVLATSLGSFLWSLLVIFFMVIYFLILFHVIVDLFRRHDASGMKKAAWVIFLIFMPLLGLLIYMIVNGEGMAQRNLQQAQSQQQQFDEYVRQTAASGGSTDEIAKAKQLLDSGAITQAEFEQLKTKALGA